jgi:hypothetical protein
MENISELQNNYISEIKKGNIEISFTPLSMIIHIDNDIDKKICHCQEGLWNISYYKLRENPNYNKNISNPFVSKGMYEECNLKCDFNYVIDLIKD